MRSGESCTSYRRDRDAADMPRGCISCRHCDGFGRCSSSRGGQVGDLETRARAARALADSRTAANAEETT